MNKHTLKIAERSWRNAEYYRSKSPQYWVNKAKKHTEHFEKMMWQWLFEAAFDDEDLKCLVEVRG